MEIFKKILETIGVVLLIIVGFVLMLTFMWAMVHYVHWLDVNYPVFKD